MAYSGRTGGSGKKKFGKSSGGGEGRGAKKSGTSSRSSRDDKTPFKKRAGDSDEKSTFKKRMYGDRATRQAAGASSFKKKRDDGDEKPAFKRRGDDDRPPFKKPFGDKPAFKRRGSDGDDKPAFRKRGDDDRPPFKKPFGDKPAFKRRDDRDDKPAFKKRGDDDRPAFKKPFGDKPTFKRRDDRDDKPAFKRRGDDDRPAFKKPFGDKPAFKRRDDDDRPKKPFGDKPAFKKRASGDKPYGERGAKPTWKKGGSSTGAGSRSSDRNRRSGSGEENEWTVFSTNEEAQSFKETNAQKERRGTAADGSIRLNKYIANTGLCSRREADDMIEAGVIKVNGKIVTELGTKINAGDVVHYGDQPLKREQLVYVLLNKPKDYITTTDDPQERKTVLDLVANACEERIYPVGRLDRNTTGVLLLTNDGDLAERLMHPKYGVQKIYQVSLDMNLKKEDFDKIVEGVELEDGFIKADELSFVGEGNDKKEIGITLHSGRNRIVRRLFEELGYKVVHLDRVSYAGLTKKNLPKGRWRMLDPKEIGFLKMKVGGDKQVKPKFGRGKRD